MSVVLLNTCFHKILGNDFINPILRCSRSAPCFERERPKLLHIWREQFVWPIPRPVPSARSVLFTVMGDQCASPRASAGFLRAGSTISEGYGLTSLLVSKPNMIGYDNSGISSTILIKFMFHGGPSQSRTESSSSSHSHVFQIHQRTKNAVTIK